MKRFSFLAALIGLALFSNIVGAAPRMAWESVKFRTTQSTAAATVRWADTNPGSNFADSSVFRKGAATATLVDTTIAYPISMFGFPPDQWETGIAARAQKLLGMQALPGGTDSVVVDTSNTTPWIVFQVRQDTTAYSYAATSGLDSVIVGAQISYDGINWLSVSGTNTRAFYANPTGISGTDGIAIPGLTRTENSPGADVVVLNNFFCIPDADIGGAYILNRTLCCSSAKYVRFIVCISDGSGQFAADIGYWES